MISSLVKLEEQLIQCRKCPRLVAWREEVARVKRKAYRDQDYWGKPVPGFGDPLARLMIMGLAPGAHGSNRTGRMFTGDGSGDFLFPALYRAGFANRPYAVNRSDGLALSDLFIAAVCRCVPPDNKPTREEVENCLPWAQQEIAFLPNLQGVVVLGRIALDGLLRLPGFSDLPKKEVTFAHGAFFQPQGGLPWIICSYHPSLQNTQTGRLTAEMFDQIWQQARAQLKPAKVPINQQDQG